MLAIRNLNVHYGGIHALRGIDIDVPDGKIISLIGANGAGKSTTLKAVMGLVPKSDGHVYWDDKDISSLKTKDIVGEGIILCPEGRRIFPDLTVDENIAAGAYLRKDKAEIARDRDWVYELFPRIAERTCAACHQGHLRVYPEDQGGRRKHPADRAERQGGPGHLRLRVRNGDWSHHDGRPGQGPACRRTCPAGVSGRIDPHLNKHKRPEV